jgi:hypothetical protein
MNRKEQTVAVTKINIQNFFHDTKMGRIFCTLIGSSDFSNECIIYFSPIFEERMWCHRIAFNFARDLAYRYGCNVLMFDYHGYGESDGDPEDFSLEHCSFDVKELITLMEQKGFSRFTWWGIRTGCSIALSMMPSCEKINNAILWDPVLDLKQYIYDSLRSTVAGQFMLFKKAIVKRDTILDELNKSGQCKREGYILNFVEGYRFGREFYNEAIKLDFKSTLKQLDFPTLLLETLPGDVKSLTLEKGFEEGKKEYFENPYIHYSKISERKFWIIDRSYSQSAEALYQTTLEWLDEQK